MTIKYISSNATHNAKSHSQYCKYDSIYYLFWVLIYGGIPHLIYAD